MKHRLHGIVTLAAREWERTILIGMVMLLASVSVSGLIAMRRPRSFMPSRTPRLDARVVDIPDLSYSNTIDAGGVFLPPSRKIDEYVKGPDRDNDEHKVADGRDPGDDIDDGDNGHVDNGGIPLPVITVYYNGFLKSGSGEERAFLTVTVDGKGAMVPLQTGDLAKGYRVIRFDRHSVVLVSPDGRRLVIAQGTTIWQK